MFCLLFCLANALCPQLQIIQHPAIESKQITETSGLVVHNDTIWLHNDSGDTARIFSYHQKTHELTIHPLPEIKAKDWEDIAINREDSILYIADTGDNKERRKDVHIISFDIQSQQSTSIPISYETGSIDLESIGWDPIEKQLLLLSKGRGGTVHLFTFSPAQSNLSFLKSLYQFPISPANGLNPERITAMDISHDGQYIAVRNYISLFLWIRNKEEKIEKTFQKTPCSYELPSQRQGESIGFNDDATSLWSISEGRNQPIFELRLLRDNPPSSR